MTQTDIGGVSPFFIVRNVPATLAFYRDKLGFEVTFEGPEADDIFFGVVQRGRAMLMFKDISVEPLPNQTRDVGKGDARWDAFIYVSDPDKLAEELASRDVEFHEPLKDTHDASAGSNSRTLTVTSSSSAVPALTQIPDTQLKLFPVLDLRPRGGLRCNSHGDGPL